MMRKDGDVMIALLGMLSGRLTQRRDCEKIGNNSIANHKVAMKDHAEE